MQKKPITGRTFADLIHFVITQRRTYMAIGIAIVISYGIYPKIGEEINITLTEARKKILETEGNEKKPSTWSEINHEKDTKPIASIETGYYTIQTFNAHYEEHAQDVMTELWRPNYQVRMEKIQGRYHVFLGKYNTKEEALLALDDLLTSELKESPVIKENKPFVKYVSKKKASISIASRNRSAH